MAEVVKVKGGVCLRVKKMVLNSKTFSKSQQKNLNC